MYKKFAEVYEALGSTTKLLEKTAILSEFLPHLKGEEKHVYLLRGRVFPGYDEREFGISHQLTIKAIAKAAGATKEAIMNDFKTIGDLGEIAEQRIGKKKQSTLMSKKLTTKLVFSNLQKLASIEGKGSVDKKMQLILELLTSAEGIEAKYIVRTLLNDLRVGVADAVLRDGITQAFYADDYKVMNEVVDSAFDKINDFAEVLRLARKGRTALEKVEVIPGRPIKVMLPVKVTKLEDAFRICGKPLAVEHKYDGFRVLINYDGKEVSLFTRKLDNVTKQFPDVVAAVKNHVKGKSFVLDSEVVGYEVKGGKNKYRPFEAISQRIRRKHDIDKLMTKLPVEINVFDIMYLNGKSTIDLPFTERRKIIEKVVDQKHWVIRLSRQFVSGDAKEINEFYKEALQLGEEGVMFKKLDAPYRPGRRVGYIVKMKPDAADLDLVIVGAEYGTGKRSGGLTSYIVACKDPVHDGKFLEVGKVASGLKEKEESDGITYSDMDKLLQPLITSEKGKVVRVKPKIVVSVTYQNVQPSPTYDSGYALRFPRITHYRPERGVHDIATTEDILAELKRIQKIRKRGLG